MFNKDSSWDESGNIQPGFKVQRMYLDGCFDVMHSGHYQALRQAASLCEELVVGVHSAEVIQKTKGCPPVQTDDERLRMLASCKWVKEAVLSEDYTPTIELLDKHNCSFAAHGTDINLDENGLDPFDAIKKANRFKPVEREVDSVSTTEIIDRILKINSDIYKPKTLEEMDADSFLLTTEKLSRFIRPNPAAPKKRTTKNKGDRVVYVSGSWDLFHSGHILFLEEAAKLGTFLIVGIHEDSTVSGHRGGQFPIMNLFERSLNVLACKIVDEIVFDAPFIITEHMIRRLRIDVVCCPTDNIDYPDDTRDEYQEIRKFKSSQCKLGESGQISCEQPPNKESKKEEEEEEPKNVDANGIARKEVSIEFVELDLPKRLSTNELMSRIRKNRSVYEKKTAKLEKNN